MQRIIYLSFVFLIIFSSCKLKDGSSTSNPTSPEDLTLSITNPNGGDILSVGTSYQIKWSGTSTALVRIQYSIDNGTTWSLVVDSLANTGVYTWFPIPNNISNQCRVRVATVDGVISAQSANPFSIVKNSNKILKIDYPIGKEAWEAGSAQQIKWYSINVDSVKIEYTTNNGQLWNLIGVDKKNTGVYYWAHIPNTPSTLAKIRITDAKDQTVYSLSPDPFTILPEPILQVTSPKGGERLYAGTVKEIDWHSENIEKVKIEFTTNNGANWNFIDSTASIGFYSWSIPTQINSQPINSQNCRIKISDAKDGQPFAVTDSVFTISTLGTRSVKVLSPNGGERLIAGSTQALSWIADGIQSVKIEYTSNSGLTWNPVSETNVINKGTFDWFPVPNITSDKCKIKITDAQDATFFDESDNYFAITPTPLITVTTPNGGEYWQSGSNQEITWKSENVPFVKIEFSSNGLADWITVANSVPSTGSYFWNNIPNMNSSQCRIKITDATYGSPVDVSDNNFTISNQVIKSIKVLTPNGGEDWEAGTSQNITWNSSGIANVKIELSTDKGASWGVIVDNYAGSAYEWNVGEALNSTSCQIRVSDATDHSISDISDAVFIISPRKFITVTGPQSAIYRSSEPVRITWDAGGIQNVGIKYTTTNGIADANNPAFYELAKVGAGLGSYEAYFSLPSDKYFVVVYNADEGSNGMPSNNSPGFTIISFTPKVTVISPNGGEQWLGNDPNIPITDHQKYHPFEIKWNADNTEKVKIEWSTNGGGSWYVVPGADSTADDGSYVWAPGRLDSPVVPDSSDNCKIRISSADKGGTTYSDVTDGYFSIHKSKKIQVKYPNSGEDFYKEDALKYRMGITWTSYAVQTVNIYISLDNGVTWAPIAADASNASSLNYPSTGLFMWYYPYDQASGPYSNNGRIKIVDVDDDKVWDINDVPFLLNMKRPQASIVPKSNSPIKIQKVK
ncbi:MAG: hypothetical protein NTX65_04245 [Ignavibacteriales bacterium]|nr:hypothetical protein [Ignavibacteriales bacterium]